MILTKQERKDLEAAASPLVKFLNGNDKFHPHVTVIVTPGSVEFLESSGRVNIEDYCHPWFC